MSKPDARLLDWSGPKSVWSRLEQEGFCIPSLYRRHVQAICQDFGSSVDADEALNEFAVVYLARGGKFPGLADVDPGIVAWLHDARHSPDLEEALAAQARKEIHEKRIGEIDDGSPLDELYDRIMIDTAFDVGEMLRVSRAGYFRTLPWGGVLWVVIDKRRFQFDQGPGLGILPLTFLLEVDEQISFLNDLRFVLPGVDRYAMYASRDVAVLGLLAFARAGDLLSESLADI